MVNGAQVRGNAMCCCLLQAVNRHHAGSVCCCLKQKLKSNIEDTIMFKPISVIQPGARFFIKDGNHYLCTHLNQDDELDYLVFNSSMHSILPLAIDPTHNNFASATGGLTFGTTKGYNNNNAGAVNVNTGVTPPLLYISDENVDSNGLRFKMEAVQGTNAVYINFVHDNNRYYLKKVSNGDGNTYITCDTNGPAVGNDSAYQFEIEMSSKISLITIESGDTVFLKHPSHTQYHWISGIQKKGHADKLPINKTTFCEFNFNFGTGGRYFYVKFASEESDWTFAEGTNNSGAENISYILGTDLDFEEAGLVVSSNINKLIQSTFEHENNRIKISIKKPNAQQRALTSFIFRAIKDNKGKKELYLSPDPTASIRDY